MLGDVKMFSLSRWFKRLFPPSDEPLAMRFGRHAESETQGSETGEVPPDWLSKEKTTPELIRPSQRNSK